MDIFIDLYTSGASVQIFDPAVSHLNPFITAKDTKVNIVAVGISIGSTLAAMKIIENGTVFKKTTTGTITYTVSLSTSGGRNISAIVVDALGQTDTASFHLVYNAPVEDMSLPAGFIDGINYHSIQRVSLYPCLYSINNICMF